MSNTKNGLARFPKKTAETPFVREYYRFIQKPSKSIPPLSRRNTLSNTKNGLARFPKKNGRNGVLNKNTLRIHEIFQKIHGFHWIFEQETEKIVVENVVISESSIFSRTNF